MAAVIGRLRGQLQDFALALLPLSAIILLNDPESRPEAVAVEAQLMVRYPTVGDSTLREQQRVPTVLRALLPPGLQGAFAAAMMGFFISTHTTYMQAWGTILVQDVLIPLHGPQPKELHLSWLRRSICLVAVLIFLWSWLMPTRDYILMFFALSGAIWNAGAGACIIGGLYWRRGTVAGAVAALVTGAAFSMLSLSAQIWFGTEVFPFNGQEILTTGSVLSTAAYVGCSLLSQRHPEGEAIVAGLDEAAKRSGEAVHVFTHATPTSFLPGCL